MKTHLPKNLFLFTFLLILISTIGNAQTTVNFTSSTTFTVPAGITQLYVEAWGGGGKGGAKASLNTGYGGGGGGAYAQSLITVIPGNTYTVTVGAGSSTTASGGNSWFGTSATILAVGGSSVSNDSSTGALGGLASACIGTIRKDGGIGCNGTATFGGGGGSTGSNSSWATNATTSSGAIASGGGGNGGNGRSGSSGSGSSGNSPGGGGGGALSNTTGGNGGNGQVTISYSSSSEINLIGNTYTILDGDTTPNSLDFTDFTGSSVGVSITRTFTIQNYGSSPLFLTFPSISGLNASDFSLTSTPSVGVSPGGSTNFTITFTPGAAGLRSATINILNSDSNENPYDFTIQGTGYAPITNGPGGVMGNLQLWLRSDLLNGTTGVADNTAVNTWNTQARGANAVKPTNVGAPIYRNNTAFNINFNSVVDFTNNYNTSPQNYTDNDATRQYLKGSSGFYSHDMFVVLIPDVPITSSVASNDIFCGDRNSGVNETDATGIGYGAYTSRIAGEVLTYGIGTSSGLGLGYGVANKSAATFSTAGIINTYNNAAVNGQELYFNAINQNNWVTDPGLFTNISNSQFWIGRSEGWDGSLDGRVAEIITLSNRATDIERSKIQSYLAIKYGITLGVNGVSMNYTNSNGATIWDASANTGYNYDIAGIGRNDVSRLNQKQSKSINPSEVMTIGLADILPRNTDNTNTFDTDTKYLVWGSNGGAMTNTGTPFTINLGPTTVTTFTEIVNRRWKIVETGGDVATVRINIPTASFVSGLPALGPNDAYVMIVADDAAFTSSLETVFMSTSGTNQTLLYDFDGTRFFTFGVAHRATNPLHISLDGIDDYVRIADANELGSTFTVMTWIRPNGNNNLADERTIIAKKPNATSGYKLVLQTNNKVRIEWTIAGTTYSSITNTSFPDQKWHNIAITYAGTTLNMYIDGVLDKTTALAAAPVATTSTFSIGSQYVSKTSILNLFKGDIDELRMWSRVLTPTEIRFLMNQEIVQNGTGTLGTIMPSTVTKNDVNAVLWSDLYAYYSMNSYIGTHLDDDSVNINRGSLIIPNKISISIQTAPMPYISSANGSWSSTATWANGSIQDLPYSLSIVNGTTPIEWNIVRTNHNVDSNGNKVLLGLFVNSNTLSASNDSKIEVSHYLKLDGKIDLQGKSQLIQTINSDLDATSAGALERDQQGTKNIFNYNYWSSPVGTINNTTNNNSFTVAGVMKDGTTSTPQNITWTTGLNGSATSPITLSSYWIFKFQNLSNSYANWASAGQNGTLNAAQGFTLKGSGSASANQNYTFVGKPNNGQITTTVAGGNLNLAGNPYASALDANAFITANNVSTTGNLYFWEHSSTNNTHTLVNYQGGYSVRNLVGGTPPSAPAGINGLGASTKVPGRYIPVSQGFFIVGSGAGGTVTFNNDQRAFIKEDNASSNTLFRTNSMLVVDHFSDNSEDEISEDIYKRVRLGLTSKDNYHRQILLGFMEQNATSGIDFGYDAPSIDNQPNDMYFVNSGAKLNIQGEGDFNVNNVYPIGIKTNVTGEVKIMVDTTENLDGNQKLFILDTTDGVYHDITNEPYIVELPQGLTDNRFKLTFKDNNTALANNTFGLNDGIVVAYASLTNTLGIKNNVVDTTVEKVSLFNMLGQLVTTFDVKDQNQENIQLPIKNLSSGTYIVKVKTDKGETTRKIVFN